MEPAGQAASLREIVGKLGHSSVQIRVRSLKSILFKLDNDLIVLQQLWAEDAEIFPLLLEWFNQPETSHQMEVLELLKRMCSNHAEAALLLAEAGGIAFMQEMKRHAPATLIRHVQDVLDVLLTVPKSTRPPSFPITTTVSTVKTVQSRSMDARMRAEEDKDGWELQTQDASLLGSALSDHDYGTAHSCSVRRSGVVILGQGSGVARKGWDVRKSKEDPISSGPQDSAGLGWDFPLVLLSREDNQLLFELDVKLKMTDRRAVAFALEGLTHAVLHHFPAETILQKPDLFRNLLGLVQTTEEEGVIDRLAVEFLRVLGRQLKHSQRLLLQQDFRRKIAPSTTAPSRPARLGACSPLQSFDGAHAIRGSEPEGVWWYPGWVQCGPNVLSTHQAAHLIFSRSIPILQDRQRVAHALGVLRVWLPLLYLCEVEEDAECEAAGGNERRSEKRVPVHVERVGEHLQAFTAVVAYHGKAEILSSRVLLAMLPVMLQLIQGIPAALQRGLVPSNLINFIIDVVTDPYVDLVAGGIRTDFAAVLRHVEPYGHSLFADTATVWESVQVLREQAALGTSGTTPDERLQVLCKALPALPYEPTHVQGVVRVLIAAMQDVDPGSDGKGHVGGGALDAQLQDILLHMLSSSEEVCTCLYHGLATTLHTVSEDSGWRRCASFLMAEDVLYEIAFRGLQDQSTISAAASILTVLLNMPRARSSKGSEGFVLPILIPHADDLKVGAVVHSLVRSKLRALPLDETVLTLCGMAMHASDAIRVPAASDLVEILRREGCLLPSRAENASADPLGALSQAECSVEDDGISSRKGRSSCFEREEAAHLVHIFGSCTLKEPIRLAAAEQIAQLAGEPHFLSCLLLAGLLDAVLAELESATSVSFLISTLQLCRVMLRSSVEAREQCREWRALKFLCPLLFYPSPHVRGWTATCLSHLVFASERLRAKGHRSADAYEEELILPLSEGPASPDAVMLPAFFRGKLMPFIPAQYYTTSSHKYAKFTHSDVVARAVRRMEEVSTAAQARRQIRTQGVEAGLRDSLPALDPEVTVDAAMQNINRAESHQQFLLALAELEAVCCADAMLAEAFLRAEWHGSLERILGTQPTSGKDDHVLTALLNMLRRALYTLDPSRAAPARNIRFLLQCIKHCLIAVLQEDAQLPDAMEIAASEAHGPQVRRGKLRIAILELIHELLEHDQNSGAFLVTPSLQRSASVVPAIMVHCTSRAGFGQRRTTEQTRLLVGSLRCCLLLTRSSDWLTLAGPHTEVYSEDGVPMLVTTLTDVLRLHASGGAVAPDAGEPQQTPLSFERKAVTRLALASLSQCLAGNAELSARWREHFLERERAGWLDRCFSDREAEVRAMAFTLAASVASSLAVHRGPLAEDGERMETDTVSAQHMRFLDASATCALDAHEADLVRQQAMQYIVRSTCPQSRVATRAAIRSFASELSWSSPRASSASDHATATASSVVRTSAQMRESSSSAQATCLLEVLGRHSLVERVLAMVADQPARDVASHARVRSSCFTLLRNLTTLDPSITAELFAKHEAVVRLVHAVDVEKGLQAAMADQVPSSHAVASRGAPAPTERWSFHGSALFASQWLCTVAPSALHGAASICDLLRIRIAKESGRSEVDPALLLACKWHAAKPLVNLLLFRPSSILARCGVHLDHSWEHRVLIGAEVDAKQAAASLLGCALEVRSQAAQAAAEQLSRMGLVRAILYMVAPSYPPRVRYLACVLFARLVHNLGDRERDEPASGDSQLHRELARSLILHFNELYSSSDGVHVDSELGIDAHRDAVVSALCALMSWSEHATEYAREADFTTYVISTLDDRVSQLALDSLASTAQKQQKRRKRGQVLPEEQGPAELEVLRLLLISKNLLFEAQEAFKDRMVEAGLPAVLFRLMSKPAAKGHAGIVKGCNQVLVNMVAGCASGQSAMVRVGGSSALAQGSSLLHGVMKMGRRNNASAESLLDCMSVMGSCAANGDCMPVLLKSTIIEDTLALLSEAADAKDAARATAALAFLLKLSCVEDGTSAVLKVVGSLSTIARTRRTFFFLGSIRYQCSLAYRNFAFAPEAKVHFVAQDGAFDAVLSDLDSGMTVAEADHCRAHAANAIWALIYNCQKTRAFMRKETILNRLSAARQALAIEVANSGESAALEDEKARTALRRGGSRVECLQSAVASLDTALKIAHGSC